MDLINYKKCWHIRYNYWFRRKNSKIQKTSWQISPKRKNWNFRRDWKTWKFSV